MYFDNMVEAFGDELEKIATAKHAASLKGTVGKHALPVAGGIAAWETMRRANKDRKIGRQVRLQQGGY